MSLHFWEKSPFHLQKAAAVREPTLLLVTERVLTDSDPFYLIISQKEGICFMHEKSQLIVLFFWPQEFSWDSWNAFNFAK